MRSDSAMDSPSMTTALLSTAWRPILAMRCTSIMLRSRSVWRMVMPSVGRAKSLSRAVHVSTLDLAGCLCIARIAAAAERCHVDRRDSRSIDATHCAALITP
jgi:hypothetical protein